MRESIGLGTTSGTGLGTLNLAVIWSVPYRSDMEQRRHRLGTIPLETRISGLACRLCPLPRTTLLRHLPVTHRVETSTVYLRATRDGTTDEQRAPGTSLAHQHPQLPRTGILVMLLRHPLQGRSRSNPEDMLSDMENLACPRSATHHDHTRLTSTHQGAYLRPVHPTTRNEHLRRVIRSGRQCRPTQRERQSPPTQGRHLPTSLTRFQCPKLRSPSIQSAGHPRRTATARNSHKRATQRPLTNNVAFPPSPTTGLHDCTRQLTPLSHHIHRPVIMIAGTSTILNVLRLHYCRLRHRGTQISLVLHTLLRTTDLNILIGSMADDLYQRSYGLHCLRSLNFLFDGSLGLTSVCIAVYNKLLENKLKGIDSPARLLLDKWSTGAYLRHHLPTSSLRPL